MFRDDALERAAAASDGQAGNDRIPWSVDYSPRTRRVCSICISSARLVRDLRLMKLAGMR
jgi:hypothetical protein